MQSNFQKFVYDISNSTSGGCTHFVCSFLSWIWGKILVSTQHQEKLLYICLICLKHFVLLSLFIFFFICNLSLKKRKCNRWQMNSKLKRTDRSFLSSLWSALCMTFWSPFLCFFLPGPLQKSGLRDPLYVCLGTSVTFPPVRAQCLDPNDNLGSSCAFTLWTLYKCIWNFIQNEEVN